MEVSVASKSTPAAVATQAVKPKQEVATVKLNYDAPQLAGGPNRSPKAGASEGRDGSAYQSLPASSSGATPVGAQNDGGKTAPTTNHGQVSQALLTSADTEDELISGNRDSDEELQAETVLVGQISQLWSSQRKKTSSLRHSRRELDKLRSDLSEKLFDYKKVLVRTGRGGKWTEFLRQQNIPRATADRYVLQRERSCCQSRENASVRRLLRPRKKKSRTW
jgi:hypothetical protein